MLAVAASTPRARYWPDVCTRMMLMAPAWSLTMAPATESIMGSLAARRRRASARRSTTRRAQVGGALGVAIIGSVLSSTYSNQIAEFLRGKNVPTAAHGSSTRPSGSRQRRERDPGSRRRGDQRFVDGMHSGPLVAAGAALLGSLIAFVFLPGVSPPRDSEEHAEHAGDR